MKIFKGKTNAKLFSLILVLGLLFAIVGCVDETIAVTSITMESADSATLIDTTDGTLQLSATLLPADATDKSVTWSVVDGTGHATIDQAGLLTAVSDGTVTVTVLSVSSDLTAELVITISNQVVENTQPLSLAILNANKNLDETMVGLTSDEFVTSTQWILVADYDIYATAIADAELILASAPLTDTEVSDAVADLNLATISFNDAKQDGTKAVMKIDLGAADDFVILSKTGIATTGTTSIVGNIGVSPVTASYITGFGLTMDGSGEYSTSALITGMVYAADYGTPTPTYLTTVIADMLIAYDDGVSRTADYTELYTGDLSGKTLATGVYKWSGNVLINSDLTLDGTATDVMIFQIAGTLTMAADTQITLTGGMLPENIYWVVADTVALGSGSAFQGVILGKANVSMGTNSSIVGMIYAQTSVSLDATSVTKA